MVSNTGVPFLGSHEVSAPPNALRGVYRRSTLHESILCVVSTMDENAC